MRRWLSTDLAKEPFRTSSWKYGIRKVSQGEIPTNRRNHCITSYHYTHKGKEITPWLFQVSFWNRSRVAIELTTFVFRAFIGKQIVYKHCFINNIYLFLWHIYFWTGAKQLVSELFGHLNSRKHCLPINTWIIATCTRNNTKICDYEWV